MYERHTGQTFLVPTKRFTITHPRSCWKNGYPRFSPRSFKNTRWFFDFLLPIFSSRGFGAETFQFNINEVLRRLGVWNHTSRSYIQASKIGEGVRQHLIRHPPVLVFVEKFDSGSGHKIEENLVWIKQDRFHSSFTGCMKPSRIRADLSQHAARKVVR